MYKRIDLKLRKDYGKRVAMDYSIHDVIKAGFNKIIFVIRKDINADDYYCKRYVNNVKMR